MNLPFTKMHGISNDYVYVDCFRQSLAGVDLPALSRRVSDRYRGVGSDGLILITPPTAGTDADVRMEMYNADGSRGEMCGNGIRCVARYAVDHDLVHHARRSDDGEISLRVETDRGVLTAVVTLAHGTVRSARIDMGRPILMPAEIPIRYDGPADRCVRWPFPVGGLSLGITCVSMGNPHAVAFVEGVGDFDLSRVGPLVEHHPMFPNRVNFHIAEAASRGEGTMRTWERGSGITQACGTGACAVLVAGVLEDRFDRTALLHLPGGDLSIEWAEATGGGAVFKTGPAEYCFTGEFAL